LQHRIIVRGGAFLVDSGHRQPSGRPLVDIALKVNVALVCAVFLFVGAIVFGVF
jgi:hypothetical protein